MHSTLLGYDNVHNGHHQMIENGCLPMIGTTNRLASMQQQASPELEGRSGGSGGSVAHS
jgi:hypothetical protein